MAKLSNNLPQLIAAAVAKQQAGNLAAALSDYDRILASAPRQPEAWINRGLVQKLMGDLAGAEESLTRGIAVLPRQARVYFELGGVLQAQKLLRPAAECFERTLQLQPDNWRACNELGNLRRELGELPAATAALNQAVKLQPDSPIVYVNLARLQLDLREWESAMANLRRAITLDPELPEAYLGMGAVLREQGRFREAEAALLEALRRKPEHPNLYNYLSGVLREQGRLAEALRVALRAIQLEPGVPGHHFNYCLALLTAGDLKNGFREYEYRWDHEDLRGTRPVMPRREWDGSDLAGRKILVYGEQGYGDKIQFVRYLALLRQRWPTARIEYHCRPQLWRLLAPFAQRWVVSLTDDNVRIDFDFHCPLMSLPFRCGTTLETIPAPVPYLEVPPEVAAAWAEPLARLAGVRVGIAWAGGTIFKRDHMRSLQLAQLGPLLAIPGVTWVCLQKESTGDEQVLPPATSWYQPMEQVADWADTAALIARLDLVISVDTAVAHLAGALGKPVWLLNRCNSEWRWMLERADSPWYPTMRIFRQPVVGDWSSVVERVAAELRARLETIS